MCFHFINQYGNSKAVPLMLLNPAPGLKPQGTFWFFAAVTLFGLAYVYLFVPETAGKSLEAMDELFSLPWYTIGRKGAALTAGRGALSEMVGHVDEQKLAQLEAERAEHHEHMEQHPRATDAV